MGYPATKISVFWSREGRSSTLGVPFKIVVKILSGRWVISGEKSVNWMGGLLSRLSMWRCTFWCREVIRLTSTTGSRPDSIVVSVGVDVDNPPTTARTRCKLSRIQILDCGRSSPLRIFSSSGEVISIWPGSSPECWGAVEIIVLISLLSGSSTSLQRNQSWNGSL